MIELWDILDKDRKITGRKHQRGKTMNKGDYHLVVHIWIVNSNKEILVTKRHPDKPYPELWECTGGSVISGESSLEGALREVKEEIGFEVDSQNGKLIKSERREETNSFYDVWLFREDLEIKDLRLQKEEVTAAKWVTRSEFDTMYKNGQVVNTLGYFRELYDLHIV